MTQTLYAHMNKIKIKKKRNPTLGLQNKSNILFKKEKKKQIPLKFS
jgi:hypothetical protein